MVARHETNADYEGSKKLKIQNVQCFVIAAEQWSQETHLLRIKIFVCCCHWTQPSIKLLLSSRLSAVTGESIIVSGLSALYPLSVVSVLALTMQNWLLFTVLSGVEITWLRMVHQHQQTDHCTKDILINLSRHHEYTLSYTSSIVLITHPNFHDWL